MNWIKVTDQPLPDVPEGHSICTCVVLCKIADENDPKMCIILPRLAYYDMIENEWLCYPGYTEDQIVAYLSLTDMPEFVGKRGKITSPMEEYEW